MAKKKKAKTTGKWEAAPDDAIRLAALRWFALQLESMAICIYATNPKSYLEMEDVLKTSLRRLRGIKKTFAIADDDDGCPDGYVRCKDGTCAPACDGIIDPPVFD
jgi:hypothetical protein